MRENLILQQKKLLPHPVRTNSNLCEGFAARFQLTDLLLYGRKFPFTKII